VIDSGEERLVRSVSVFVKKLSKGRKRWMMAEMQKEDVNVQPSEENMEQGRGPEDGENSRDGTADSSSGKRKYAEREPESPGQNPDPTDPDTTLTPYAKKERTYYGEMNQDSPSSYPKHVIVPSTEGQYEEKEQQQQQPQQQQQQQQPPSQGMYSPEDPRRSAAADFQPEQGTQVTQAPSVLTPDSAGRGRPAAGYEAGPPIYPRQQMYPEMYRAPSYQEMDYGRPYGSQPPAPGGGDSYRGGDNFVRPRRWACDYCNVATFLSYEEACAHEEACARRHHESQYHDPRHPPRPPTAATYGPPRGLPPPHPSQPTQPPQGSGLGALYHASQEVVTPPTPHGHHQSSRGGWGSRGPPLPVLPHDQEYYRQGYYDSRQAPDYYSRPDPYGYQHQQQQPYPYPPQQYYQKRMLLALPSDSESLSDRQCFVRSEMVEIFAATEKDVAARHSKGAQKLVMGQVGIRCVHCSHIRPRDRAERAVCYPSSISRIYQTVADMQRFHFEQCREIPDHVRQTYKQLKTTRPRGVGSPQSYWVQSAKSLGLVDTGSGIRFDTDLAKQQQQQQQSSEMSISTL